MNVIDNDRKTKINAGSKLRTERMSLHEDLID